MTGEIVNLRRARKTRARVDEQKSAAVNRTAFGRSKAERAATEAEKNRRERALDGAKRDG